MRSDNVTDLLPALAAAIADMRDPIKNARNPHFKNRFADLGEVLDCIKGPLHEHGLLVTQTCHRDELITRVWHIDTGQYIDSITTLVMDKNSAQAQGSAITYARRYALKALFGMFDVDDDGEAASQSRQTKIAPVKRGEHRGATPYANAVEAETSIDKARTTEGLQQIAVRLKASHANISDEEMEQLRKRWAESFSTFKRETWTEEEEQPV